MPFKNLEINTSVAVNQQPRKKSHFYKGFSTVNVAASSSQLFDYELIKQDILNHFKTKKGERVMNPNFGSVIWDLLMEPLTDATRETLKDDIKNICTSDPRIVPIQMDLTEYDNGYILELTLQLQGTDQSLSMRLAFDQKLGLISQ